MNLDSTDSIRNCHDICDGPVDVILGLEFFTLLQMLSATFPICSHSDIAIFACLIYWYKL